MYIRLLVGRLIALPVHHKLIAAGIVVAFIAGYLGWASHLPSQEYTSSALLFFDRTAAPEPGPGILHTDQTKAMQLARSILSDDSVKTICKHFGLYPDSSGGEAARFRSNLTLSGESTSSLRVSWRGTDRGQTVAVTNTVAVLLTSWVPGAAHQSSEPGPAEPALLSAAITPMAAMEPKRPANPLQAKPSPAKARLARVLNAEMELQVLLAEADKGLSTLGDEARRLEAGIGQANAERQASIIARQPLTEQLAMEKKKLDLLRVRYTDAYPDVEAAQERIAETEQKLAAMPAVLPAPDAEQARLGAVTKQMNRLSAEKVRLSAELSENAKLETTLRSKEVDVPAIRPEQALTEPQPEQGKPRLRDTVPPRAPAASSSQTADSTDGEPVRVFRILERAANAQPTNNPNRLLPLLVAVAGSLSGVLYLLLAVWWFHAVRNAETLERILPENVAYLGAIPGMNTWRHNT
jgi:hypothetical protein